MLAQFIQLFIVLTAKAQVGGSIGSLPNPTGVQTIGDLLNKIAGYLYQLAIPLVAIMVTIGGFQILFAGGNPEGVTKGKKTILYAVVGFTIILLASGVVFVIKDLLGTS